MAEQPILELIRENIKDGELPENFLMPQDRQSHVFMAPGARDGLYVFHSTPEEVSEADKATIARFLDLAAEGKFEEAEQEVLMLGNKSKALPVMPEVQEYITNHIDGLNGENIFKFACILMEQSADVESVKFGLGISMLYICMDEGYKDTVRTLALSDEFTLPAVINMLEWDWPVGEVWEAAKKVHGWGRIHAVDRLEPATQMIADWIFFEGIKNNIDPGYSVFMCWMASNADERIQHPMARDEFEAASRMIEALLKDTPAPGLSIMGNAEDILTHFLERAEEQQADAGEKEREADRALIKKIRDFAADQNHEMKDIIAKCDALLP